MDGSRFDGLTKGLASLHSRRTLGGLLAGLLSPLGALAPLDAPAASAKKKNRKKKDCLANGRRCGRKSKNGQLVTCRRCCSKRAVNRKKGRRCAGRPSEASCSDNRQCSSGLCRGGACHATDYTVCPSGCAFDTIHAAVDAANPGHTVHIYPGHYVFDRTINLTKNLTLAADGPNTTTFDGDGGTQVFHVAAQATVVIRGLTITDGLAQIDDGGRGGAILNEGSLTLDDVVVTGNLAQADGGGIHNTGTLVLNGCDVTNNGALSGAGGGIWTSSGAVTLTDTNIEDNQAESDGGGISSTGPLRLKTCNVKGNSTGSGNGGGMQISLGATTLEDCGVSLNKAAGRGGGIDNIDAKLVLRESLVNINTAGTDGGGIYVATQAASATLTDGSWVVDNTAQGNGGGLNVFSGSLTLEGGTSVTRNKAASGGGLFGSDGPPITIADAGIVLNNHPNNCAGEGIPATCVG